MNGRRCSQWASLLLALTMLPGCVSVPGPETSPTPEAEPKEFVVLAYATSGIVTQIIPYQRLTHITYAFLIPNHDGTFAPLNNGWKLKTIVSEAHAQGVKVLISVGGWGWDEQFETLAADPASRAVFVQGLTDLVAEYELDGVDLDWEYPDPGQSAQNFLALVKELRSALTPNSGSEKKLLTSAVVSYGDGHGLGIPPESFELLDMINVMSYDGPDHSTMAQTEMALEYWLGRGVPPEKLILGIPFYAQPNGVSFAKLVKAEPQAANLNEFEYGGSTLHYNGIPSVQTKTRLALEKAGGVMFWALDHDSQGETSLLRAIDETLKEALDKGEVEK